MGGLKAQHVSVNTACDTSTLMRDPSTVVNEYLKGAVCTVAVVLLQEKKSRAFKRVASTHEEEAEKF